MHTTLGLTNSASPLLFRYAIPRISWAELPGHYDPDEQVWVIELNAELVPVVQTSDPTLLDTSTVTKVRH